MEITKKEVSEIIDLATKARRSEREVDPEADIVDQLKDTPEELKLSETIDALPERKRAELVVLTWMGRGDFPPEEYEHVLAGRNQDSLVSNAGDYLTEKEPLDEYLREALKHM